MSGERQYGKLGPREALDVVNQIFPNIGRFLRYVLKNEQLGQEAESLRTRYDTLLGKLERMASPIKEIPQQFRPISFAGDDSKLLHLRKRQGIFPELQKNGKSCSGDLLEKDTPNKHNGHLLCRDPTKSRWHRYLCYISSPEALLYFYDPADDSSLVTTVPLSGRTIISGEAADQQTGKENSLIVTRIGDGIQEYYLAAFNPEEYKSWLDTLNRVIENISLKAKRNSMPCFGNYAPDRLGLWTVVPGFDFPSNGDSSRDSAISSGSSSHRVSWAPNGSSSPFRPRKAFDLDTEDLPVNSTIFRPPKPLPSPPVENLNSKSGDGDDVTIYEDIEELQEMVDKQLKQTQVTISQIGKGKDYHHKSGKSGKKRKKTKGSNLPENSNSSIVSLPLRDMMSTKSFSSGNIITPTSTLTRNKPNHSQVHLMPERNILDRNASTYSSFLHMRGVNTRWERRWFTLQKSVLTYTRDQTDKEAQIKVLVGCKVESFKDSKRSFAMRISQIKEPDMFLSAEDEIQFIEWLTKLQMATKVQSSFENLENIDGSSWNIMEDPRDSLAIDSSYVSSAGSCRTSIVSMDYTKRVLPQLPIANGGIRDREYTALIPTEDNPSDTAFLSDLSGEGIYDVPRSVIAPYGGKILINGVRDIYDHPRGKFINIRDDEGVYISPNEDDEDEDIYAYPPDALDDYMLLTQEEALQSLGVYDYPKVSRGSTVSSSASTYRDSSMSESTLRDSHASYVTIHESQGQSIPQMADGGTTFMNGYAGNGEVKFSAGELSELMNPASRASQAIEEGLYDRPKSLWSSATEDIEIEPLDTMAGGIKGYLYRKERFQWTKMLCCIKNNRFECYKGNTITLKLFLPGAEVFPDTEAKRPYALKIKHPRKETTLQFAAESEVQYKMWLSAFIKAASISVQSVNDVEQIRVVDSAMKEKWKNLEISQLRNTKDKKKLVKANTVTALDPPDKGGDDSTLQRKKKLTDRITKGVFSGKRKKKSSFEQQSRALTRSPVSPKPSQSNEDLLAASDTEPIEGGMKRSLSLDTVIATNSPINSPKHKSLKQRKAEAKKAVQIPTSNAGYLLVQQTRMQGANAWVRYWSVLDNLIINFYPSRMDIGSHFKISLRGSRVSRAMQETQRPLSFMIWHLESGSRVFCVAENESEFISWFEILTNGSEHVVPSIQDNIRRSASFYYFPSDYTQKIENDQLSGSEHTLTVGSRDHLSSQYSLNSSQENIIQDIDFCGSTGSMSSLGTAPVQYAGILKHKNSSDNWVQYNCMIRKSSLYMFKNPNDRTPVSVVVLPKCQVAKIDDATEEHVFTVLEYESKTPHVFAAHTSGELPHWLSNIQECSEDRVSLHELRKMKQWLSNEDISENQRKQYKSAEDLSTIPSSDNIHLKTMSLQRTTNTKKFGIENTIHSGFVEVLFKGSSSWSIYWCTVKDRHLYMYQTQQSNLPLKSIRLSKYTVHTDSSQAQRPHCLVLTYPSTQPIYISVSDNLEKQRWLQVLLRATQADAIPHSEKDSISSCESVKLSDSHGSALDQCGGTPENTLEKKKRRILKQYDRNMKKTHKFSKQTTDSLKREKRGLVAMKEQIAPHLEKLEGLSSNGDERAQEKFIALQVKVKQIDAVLPYLEKCITKNKEAEQKTIAILEKKRDEELAALEKGTPTVNSSTDKSETDRQNSTSDLYMKVLAEGDMEENPQIDEEIVETNGAVYHSTPSREVHTDIMNSTPVQLSGAPENPVITDDIIPITLSHDYQEDLTSSLDETIIASASMVQEHVIPVVVEPNNETILQTDVVNRSPAVDASSSTVTGELELVAMSNLNSEFSVMEPRPRAESNSKPPPIKPKKKKVPPPRPPRRSSSYLSDGIELSDIMQSSSVVLVGDVAPQPPYRSSSCLSDNVESQGSPVLENRHRQSTDLNITATSSPVISAGPPVAARPRRSGSHLSQGSPVPDIRQRQSSDHSVTMASSPVISAGPPVASRPRRSGSHLSDNIELQGSPVIELRRRQSADHGPSNMTATSSPVLSAGPPVASRPRRSGSHLSDNIELQGSPVVEPRPRWSNDHSTAPAIPSNSSETVNNKTTEYLGEHLANVSVFSKIKAFEKT